MVSLNQIASICSATEVNVTPQGQAMIQAILDSIVEDPHPRWKAERADLFKQHSVLLGMLPQFLRELVRHDTVFEGTVTTYDILHWLSSGAPNRIRLESICPFDK